MKPDPNPAPARFTLADARRLVSDPAAAAERPVFERQAAWLVCAHDLRQRRRMRRLVLHVTGATPTDGDAA